MYLSFKWTFFDRKNELFVRHSRKTILYGTVSGLTTDFMEHQVDRAFCLWSKFANVNFRRKQPKDCRKDECWHERSKADIKITDRL